MTNLLRLTSSPWGAVQHITQIAEGIVSVSTASHGGIKVSDERLALMPENMRSTTYSGGGWFEEDCDWCLVAVTFPEAFSDVVMKDARDTFAACFPHLVATDDDGCPKGDPECLGNNGDCHDACEAPDRPLKQATVDRVAAGVRRHLDGYDYAAMNEASAGKPHAKRPD